MADWIKMRSSLLTNLRVIRMARVLLNDPEFTEWLTPGRLPSDRDDVTKRDVPVVTRIVVGALLATWATVNDTAGSDGVVRHASSRDIDLTAGVPGFGKALMAVNWMQELPNSEGVVFVNFEEHNSPQKERSLTAKSGAERSREYRGRLKTETSRVTKSDDKRDDGVTSQRDSREEKKREEKNTPKPPAGGCRRFEEFWTAWPKSERKQDKVKCAEKWRKGNFDEVADEILADIAVKRQTTKWQEDGGKYIEGPLVYLNGRRWEDGVEAAGQHQETFV